MKRFLGIFSLLVLVSLPPLYAANEGVDFTIRFYNQQIAFPDSKIPIKIEISNNSPQTFRFKLADHHAFNIDFNVKTLTNVDVQHSDQFIMERNTNQPVFFRDVSLDPGDQYSFVENLSDFAKIAGPGVYLIQGLFYPDLYTPTTSSVMKSNTLTLSVRPGSTPAVQAAIDQATGEVLQQEALAPDEVVSYTIHARQKGEWNKFFLYIDTKNLMLQQPDMKRRYDRSSDQQQRDMVASFKQQLEQENVDSDILVVPSDFTIVKTSYTSTEATVVVNETFKHSNYSDVKEYTYYLQRPERVWMIYNYTVRNLGTK